MEEPIKIVANNICIDIEELRRLIVDKWQSGELYRFYYNQGNRGELLYNFILDDLDDYVDGIYYAMNEKAKKDLGRPNSNLDWYYDKYPKSDVRSIGFEVFEKLSIGLGGPIESLTTDDIPIILEFLDTPPDKTLEAWEKWESYWANLDYPERRRKLLQIR